MIKTIEKNLFFRWLAWHFKSAPAGILRAWRNFLRFSLEFFSIKASLKTLFSPWKRITEPYREGLANLTENLQALLLNSFSRFLGFLVRIVLITIGLVFTGLVLLFGLILFLVWFVLPLLIVAGIVVSLILII